LFVDLINGVTSGSARTSRIATPDTIQWENVPFGTRLIDHPGSVSNHASDTDFTDQFIGLLEFSVTVDSNGQNVLRVEAEHTSPFNAFSNYFVTVNADWFGREPLQFIASGNGTFSHGVEDPVTGLVTVDPADAANLTFTPELHFSGDTGTLTATHGSDVDVLDIEVVQVADVPTLAIRNPDGYRTDSHRRTHY